LKTILVIFFAILFLSIGAINCLKQVSVIRALEEIVSFINLIKMSVNYTAAGFDEIILNGKKQNYKYVSFSDNEIYLDKSVGNKLSGDFNSFINKIGTTDQDGQINICEEYRQRFQEKLFDLKIKEKEKIQVNTALSVFGALTVLIFFL
jgi:hypothetical protein